MNTVSFTTDDGVLRRCIIAYCTCITIANILTIITYVDTYNFRCIIYISIVLMIIF